MLTPTSAHLPRVMWVEPLGPGPRRPVRFGALAGTWLTVMLAFTCSDAPAAALGSLTTSMGLFAALTTLLWVEVWPAQLPAASLPAAAATLLVIGGAAWLWRVLPAQPRIAWFHKRASAGAQATAPIGSTGRIDALVLPRGIEVNAVLNELRLQFVRMQAAWDKREMTVLRQLTTPEMLDELCFDWPADSPVRGADRTDVVTLHAQLLGFEEVSANYLVSVEFSGLIREGVGQVAVPFREVWMLAQPKPQGSGWKLARHQVLL